MPLFTQNLLKKIMADKAFDSPHYLEIEKAFTSQFMIRLSPRPDIFAASLKQMNRVIYKELQGPSEFIMSGTLHHWSITEDLWKIQGTSSTPIFFCSVPLSRRLTNCPVPAVPVPAAAVPATATAATGACHSSC